MPFRHPGNDRKIIRLNYQVQRHRILGIALMNTDRLPAGTFKRIVDCKQMDEGKQENAGKSA
jgi:hypothetical protein